jgi:dipeptidyl aminopeptidase/acylaminoacyl peptidase
MHGPDDAVVPASQSRRFAAALERAGKEHLYLETPECDHDMTADACRRTVFEALAAFLKHHLHDEASR